MNWKKVLFLLFMVWFATVACTTSHSTSNKEGEKQEQKQEHNPLSEALNNSPKVFIPTSIFPSLGNPESKVKLDVFFDVWCPACRMFDKELSELLKTEKYKDKLVVYFHLFPLIQHFPKDREATLLYLEMTRQNLFLDFHKAVVEKDIRTYDDMVELAKSLTKEPLNLKEIEKKNAPLLEKMQKEAQKLDLSHTPTIYINDREIVVTPSLEEMMAGLDQIKD